jgi:hypothetical protein
MAVIRGWRFLDSNRINRVVRTLADELEAAGMRNLLALQRTPVVNADDDEIVGKFKGQFVAADVIADDQQAVVYNTVGQLETVTNSIPNIKMGSRIGQKMIDRLARLRRNLSTPNDIRFFTDWENTIAEQLIVGVRQRINALICAMWLDDGDYDKYGLVMQNVSWGTPAGLKKVLTSTDRWSTDGGSTANVGGTNIMGNILEMVNTTGPEGYAESYNRITMSSKAFRFLSATTEFSSWVGGDLRFNFQVASSGNSGTGLDSQGRIMPLLADAGTARRLTANMLGIEIEIYDGYFYSEGNAGKRATERYLPENVIIFSNSEDDNDNNAMDFANGIVTESIVSDLVGQGGIGGEAFGPIAYYTGNTDLNPPDIRAWAVARGFPRKHRETATATITVW